jgi:hypothetical protein
LPIIPVVRLGAATRDGCHAARIANIGRRCVMSRKRLWASGLLAVGTSAAVAVAGDPPTPALPAHVVQAERPPEKLIRYELGFEPWPLEEATADGPAPVKAPVPAPEPTAALPTVTAPMGVIPPSTVNAPMQVSPPPMATAPMAVIPPPPSIVPPPIPSPSTGMTLPQVASMPQITPPPQPKVGAVSLTSLERLVLDRFAAPKPTSNGQRLTLQPAGATEPNDTILLVSNGFVDHVAAAGARPTPPDQVATLTQEYRLLNAVRLHYYHLLALERMIAVREELAGICRDAATTIESMIGTGRATKAELLHARIEAREQMAALQAAKSTHDAVWHRMAMLVGQPDMPVGTLEGDVEQCCTVPALDACWAHLIDASPELKAVRGELNRRQTALRQNLTTTGKVSTDKTNGESYFGQAVASFAGGAFAKNEPSVKQTEWRELSQLEQEVGRIQQSLRNRLVDSYVRHDHAQKLVELYRSQNLPDAKEAFELSVISFRQGRGSWPEVQIAQRNYFRMSTEYVEALAELRRAELAILGLVMDVHEESQPTVRTTALK